MTAVGLLRAIQRDVELLDRISPRDFEEVVAELLASFGWEVSLTTAAQEGAHDILAFEGNEYGLAIRVIVECKRYRTDRSVGVAAVRQLAGMKSYVGANKALLVTTSWFTAEAKRFADAHPWDLQLIDRSKLLEWMRAYSSSAKDRDHRPREEFDSCFISHSQKNHVFASTLYRRLEAAGVRVWFAPEHMRAGEKLKEQVDRAIAAFDRVIAILSTEALASDWVSTELGKALRIELSERRRVLFPITLIPYSEIKSWQCFDADLGRDIAAAIREYHVLDFSDWHNPERFEAQFARLLDGLAPARAA